MQREKFILHRAQGRGAASEQRWARPYIGAALCVVGMASSAAVMAAGITVNAGDDVTWGASMDLGCDDLVVNGILNAPGVAFTRVGNVIIGSAGQLNAANTTFEVTSSWQNSGAFSGAGSTVTASNACSNTSTAFSGNTNFANLTATSPGLQLNFAAGSEQTVSGALTLNGVTLTGQGGTAFLTLAGGGSQNIANVGVNGVDASHGTRLAPTGTNVIPNGAANNWFAAKTPPVTPTAATPVPVTGPGGLALLAGLMLGAAHWVRRRSPGSSRRKAD
ncbi:IPTL-CTERM sorting domain-containing protein [Diaphorobacter ruginosibacter]|uniref:IPTL-CTERM sorting domain-containing protein n=1 Tax=Diaphorobacter ruginosibacter TaxID=1715720 RepID=A0A7G9RLI6_9BURK|nr:IPTL-CTERM sorting domain-containing protein [Diaphorobacter ruginosibacter]QNN56461.1 IPTL-CTERM sorting domain-containing protein [Diaphorobacter ruginosibacter]